MFALLWVAERRWYRAFDLCVGGLLLLASPAAAEEPVEREREHSAEAFDDFEAGSESEYLTNVDDFGVPDEFSFESPWDLEWEGSFGLPIRGVALDLLGGVRTRMSAREVFAGAWLSIPFGVPPRPGLVSSGRVSSESLEREQFPGREAGVRVVEEEEGNGVPSVSRAAAEISSTVLPLSPLFVREISARATSQTQTRDLEARLDDLARRERVSGLLPELRLRGAYGLDQSTALDTLGNLSGETRTRDAFDSVVEARLTFRLHRLVVGDGELALERARQTLREKQTDALRRLLDILSDWDEARTSLARTDLGVDEVARWGLKEQAARLRLHVLTGGWFPLDRAAAEALAAGGGEPGRLAPPDVLERFRRANSD